MEGQVLDLGAGSCWFSAELSRWPEIERVFALDFSERLLEEVAPQVIAHLAGDETRITRVVGDFHRLEFPDDSVDHVVFDAAVHHVPADSFAVVFDEIRRVLKPGGSMVAIREPVLPVLPGLKEYKRRAFGRHERQFGVTENSFTRGE
jgi:ubiquinone/menaquinone biosynthesis C-methylase UbiE